MNVVDLDGASEGPASGKEVDGGCGARDESARHVGIPAERLRVTVARGAVEPVHVDRHGPWGGNEEVPLKAGEWREWGVTAEVRDTEPPPDICDVIGIAAQRHIPRGACTVLPGDARQATRMDD